MPAPLETRREKRVAMQVTNTQRATWESAAAEAGQLLADFVRRAADDAAAKVLTEAERRRARAAKEGAAE